MIKIYRSGTELVGLKNLIKRQHCHLLNERDYHVTDRARPLQMDKQQNKDESK